MSRAGKRVWLLQLIAVLAIGASACGKYGKPVRSHPAAPAMTGQALSGEATDRAPVPDQAGSEERAGEAP